MNEDGKKTDAPGPSPKQGAPLVSIPEFAEGLARALRDELSVTTAEEFVDLAHRQPALLRKLLHLRPDELQPLVERAAAQMSPDTLTGLHAPESKFATGQDAPPSGKKTFYEGNDE